ncbi:uncharacterized protein LOC104414960 [Eucalyptus grandis]|uniref:uncharacterized protein LOC104414960 n=1 Tax=Eucalyptus grandis TaxID=71139 RepID=UPI00192EC3BC|nr:uncharacterized protein LOC104414960 [Eucalyptus grandis]
MMQKQRIIYSADIVGFVPDDKATVLESEKWAWENLPEAQAVREALTPWRNCDAERRIHIAAIVGFVPGDSDFTLEETGVLTENFQSWHWSMTNLTWADMQT